MPVASTGALLGAAGISAAAGLGGAFANESSSKGMAKKAWQRQKKAMQKGIQWRTADLKAAGINPILASGASVGGGSAPSVNMAQSSDRTAAAEKGAATAKALSMMDSEIAGLEQAGYRDRQIGYVNHENAALTKKMNEIEDMKLKLLKDPKYGPLLQYTELMPNTMNTAVGAINAASNALPWNKLIEALTKGGKK